MKNKKNRGPCVYYDWSTKGKEGRKKRHNTYRADLFVSGKRIRKRLKDREKLQEWIEKIQGEN